MLVACFASMAVSEGDLWRIYAWMAKKVQLACEWESVEVPPEFALAEGVQLSY
jgi:hypothetical protein